MKILPKSGSFERQLVLAYTAGFSLLIAVFAVHLFRSENAYLYRGSYNEASGLASSLAVSSVSLVLADDVSGLQEAVSAFKNRRELRYAMVLSLSGQVLAHTDAAKVGLFVSGPASLSLIKAPPEKQVILDSSSEIDIAEPILASGRPIAWARIAQGRKSITHNLRQMAVSCALLTILAVVLAFLSARVIAGRLGTRIGSLAGVMEQVQAGNLEARANVTGTGDEIAKLASGLNSMLEVLAQTIAGQKRGEKALRESEAKFRRIVDTANEGFCVIGPDGRATLVNARMADMLGYSAEEMIGKPVTVFMFEEDAEDHEKKLKNRRRGLSERYERRLRRKDGQVIWTIVSATPTLDEELCVVDTFALITDITELKRNEEMYAARLHLWQFAMTRSLDELLEETLNETEKLTGSLIGFYHFVEDDQVSLTLQAWSTRTKSEFCKAEGKGLHYPVTEAGVWGDCVRERKPILHNDYASLPHRKGLPEGHAKVVREIVVPVFRGEKILAILGVGNKPADYTEKDVETVSLFASLAWTIAERKRMEEQARLAEQRAAALEISNKDMEAFSYSVSHNLKIPLRAIDGFSGILQSDYSDELGSEGQRLLGVVRRNTKRMEKLIDDILRFIRFGRAEMTIAGACMDELVREALAEAKLAAADGDPQVEIGPLPPARGDVSMLRQVLVELLSNAIKFSRPKQNPRIQVGGFIEGKETVYFVKDNGAGFDMKYSGQLFGVFQRLHGVDEFEGTGVGLAIVKRIASRHGGRVWAKSAAGEGTAIYFALPGADASTGEAGAANRGVVSIRRSST